MNKDLLGIKDKIKKKLKTYGLTSFSDLKVKNGKIEPKDYEKYKNDSNLNDFINSPEYIEILQIIGKFFETYKKEIEKNEEPNGEIFEEYQSLIDILNKYNLKNITFDLVSRIPEINDKSLEEVSKETIGYLQEIKTEELALEENINGLIKELLKDKKNNKSKKQPNEEESVLQIVLQNIQNSTKKEIVETLRVYFEIKKEIGEEDSLKTILQSLKEKKNVEPLIEDINRFTLNELYPKVNNKRVYKGQSSGVPDIEFFFIKSGKLHSKSGSITLSGEYYFEGTQNNFHSYRTSLKRHLIENYSEKDKLIQEGFDISKTINNRNSFPTELKWLLKEINSLGSTEINLLQKSNASLNEVIEYLSIFTYKNNSINKSNLNKKKTLKTILNEELEKGNNIETFLKDKEQFKTNFFNDLDYYSKVEKTNEEGQKYFKRDKKYDKDSSEHKKKVEKHIENIDKILDKINEIPNQSETNIETISNDNNHSHIFSILNNSIIIKEKSNVIEEDLGLGNTDINDNIYLSILIVGFSHIKNEFNLENVLDISKSHDKIPVEYYERIFQMHKNWNIRITYTSETQVFSSKDINFIELLSDENKIIQALDNLILKLDNKDNKLNKTLRLNAIESLSPLKTYYESINNHKILKKLEEVYQGREGLKDVYIHSSDNKKLKEATQRAEEENKKEKEEILLVNFLLKINLGHYLIEEDFEEVLKENIDFNELFEKIMEKANQETPERGEKIRNYVFKNLSNIFKEQLQNLETPKIKSEDFGKKIKETQSNPPKNPKKLEELSEDKIKEIKKAVTSRFKEI